MLTFRQGIAHIQHRHQVVYIAVDALSHTGVLGTNTHTKEVDAEQHNATLCNQLQNHHLKLVDVIYDDITVTVPSLMTASGTTHLYFHGHLPAILHPRQVNLADGRCSKRTLLKRL